MKLIVGLGNVGDKYAATRHNLGFMVVDALADQNDLKFETSAKLGAQTAKGQIDGVDVVLAKPTTMMNLSGGAVAKLAQFYKVEPKDIWVIYDELDLPYGKVRIRERGSDAGHNGVASVAKSIGGDFIRWRIGIGKPEHRGMTVDFVLSRFDEVERELLGGVIRKVSELVTSSLSETDIQSHTVDTLS